jgi:diadenosine tetraphosphate (Ap4A) HIT family hydrolase
MSKDHSIPSQFHIAGTSGWSVNHRINSALPGYLMIGSTKATNDLSDLSAETLASMGTVFAKVQRALHALGAQRVYISRYGHSPGYPS